MLDSTPPPTSPPSSSSVFLPSSRPGWAASLITAAPALLLLWVVGRPIGQALPRLLDLYAQTHDVKPIAAALLALGFCAAPVPTVELLSRQIGRFLPAKTKE